MKITSKKTTSKTISYSSPSISYYDNNTKSDNLKKQQISKSKISSLKNKIFLNLNYKIEKENEAYGYELEQSIDNDLDSLKENIVLFSNEKENGEIIGNKNNHIIKKEKFQINRNLKNKEKNLNLRHNYLYNNGFEQNNINNNFCLDLENNRKYLYENKNIKKSIIIQQILINDMKKELENEKLQNEKLKNKFDIQKKKLLEQYEIKLNNNMKENIELNKIINNQKIEIKSLNNLINEKKEEIIINYSNKEDEERNNINIIDNSYETIKQISKKFSNFIGNKYLKDDKIILKNINTFIEHINIDNNGKISTNDKLLTIKEFINIINSEIENLFSYKNIESKQPEINICSYFNKYDKNLKNNLNESENGQTNLINNRIKSDKKRCFNNKIFKKIHTNINKNNFSKTSNIKENTSKRKCCNEKKKFKSIINKSIEEINKNNNIINLKSRFLEKNSIVYKSNLSPISNTDSILNTSNNEIFSFKYNKIINNILNNNETIKNIKLNSNLKEIEDMLSNINIIKDNYFFDINKYFKNFKKSKIPVPENIKINKTINCRKIKNFEPLRIRGSNRNKFGKNLFRPIYKNSSCVNNINHLNSTFDTIPFITNYKSIHVKKKIPLNNNYNNKGKERNKINKLDYIKTDIKKNEEYIKIDDIFTNLNSSNILSNSNTISFTKNSRMNTDKVENSPSQLDNKSCSLNENKSKYIDINNNEKINKKTYPKILIKQQNKNNNYKNIKKFTQEIMKQSFLKNNVNMTLK